MARVRATVDAAFFHQGTRAWKLARVSIPTGGQGVDHAMTIACSDHAWDNRYTHWVQPKSCDGKPPFLAFKSLGRSSRVFLKEFPNKEGAVMWLVHAKF